MKGHNHYTQERGERERGRWREGRENRGRWREGERERRKEIRRQLKLITMS